jgi:hypothetical protein
VDHGKWLSFKSISDHNSWCYIGPICIDVLLCSQTNSGACIMFFHTGVTSWVDAPMLMLLISRLISPKWKANKLFVICSTIDSADQSKQAQYLNACTHSYLICIPLYCSPGYILIYPVYQYRFTIQKNDYHCCFIIRFLFLPITFLFDFKIDALMHTWLSLSRCSLKM